jgi:hypothetical protein
VTNSAQPVPGAFTGTAVGGAPLWSLPGTSQGWTSEHKIDWITTLRARLGWAHGSALWYATGGVAWAKIEDNHTLFSTPGATSMPTSAT